MICEKCIEEHKKILSQRDISLAESKRIVEELKKKALDQEIVIDIVETERNDAIDEYIKRGEELDDFKQSLKQKIKELPDTYEWDEDVTIMPWRVLRMFVRDVLKLLEEEK